MVEFLINLLIITSYFAIVLGLLSVLLKVVFKVPKEIVRKVQHIGYALSIFLFLYLFDVWYHALIINAIFIVFISTGLWLFEKTRYYKIYFVDRETLGGELKYSLIQAQLMFALLIFFFSWLLPRAQEYIIVIAVMCWGVGDALAALIGRRFGRLKINMFGADHKKTWEGSSAMAVSVFLVMILLLLFYAGIVWWVALIASLVIAPLSMLIEAYAHKGTDTLILPLSIAFLLYGILMIFYGIGVL